MNDRGLIGAHGLPLTLKTDTAYRLLLTAHFDD